MNNLKQKEMADQEELKAEQILYENIEDAKGLTIFAAEVIIIIIIVNVNIIIFIIFFYYYSCRNILIICY